MVFGLKFFKSNRRISTSALSFGAGAFISLFIALLYLLGVFNSWESRSLDIRLKLRGEIPVNSAVQVIGIDDTSLSAFGRWPWPRSYMAQFLDFLTPHKPRAVVFDMIFPEPTEENEAEDVAFSKALQKNGNAIIGAFFRPSAKRRGVSQEKLAQELPGLNQELERFAIGDAGKRSHLWYQGEEPTLSLPILSVAAQETGYVNVVPDSDGKMRHIPLVLNFNQRLYPSLALRAVMSYWDLKKENVRFNPGHWIELARPNNSVVRIPVDSKGYTTINYAGPISVFRPLSFAQLMAAFYGEKTEGAEAVFKRIHEGIILIGVSATASTDLISTPFVSLEPGVSLQASLINSILQQKFIYPSPLFLNLLILLVLGSFLGWLIPRLRPATGFLSFLGISIVYPALACLAFFMFGFWLSLVTPLVVVGTVYLVVVFIQFVGERMDKQALEQELLIAQKIQKSFLPKTLPETKEAAFAADIIMAKSVGGDLYDFLKFEDGSIGVVIGDVSGKGVPAALYMAKTISDLRAHGKSEKNPVKVITLLNNTLLQEGASGMFVTLFYVLLDLAHKKITYSSAGHHPLLKWQKATGTITEHNTKKGRPLGILPIKNLDEGETAIESGDLLMLYTDGIDEAMNRSRQSFGKVRMLEVLQKNSDKTPTEIIQAFHKAVQDFVGSAPQHDDMTLVVIRIN